MRLLDLMRCVANNELEADPKLGEDAIDIRQARVHGLRALHSEGQRATYQQLTAVVPSMVGTGKKHAVIQSITCGGYLRSTFLDADDMERGTMDLHFHNLDFAEKRHVSITCARHVFLMRAKGLDIRRGQADQIISLRASSLLIGIYNGEAGSPIASVHH